MRNSWWAFGSVRLSVAESYVGVGHCDENFVALMLLGKLQGGFEPLDVERALGEVVTANGLADRVVVG